MPCSAASFRTAGDRRALSPFPSPAAAGLAATGAGAAAAAVRARQAPRVAGLPPLGRVQGLAEPVAPAVSIWAITAPPGPSRPR